MKQRSMSKNFSTLRLANLFIMVLSLSACSTTFLRFLDTAEIVATNEVSVYLETQCDGIEFGDQKLNESLKTISQAVSDYGFSVVQKEQADFLLNFVCRKESDLNFGLIPNGISAAIMVVSITTIPTYWPSDLWLDMEVYDLRALDAERLDTLTASYVSQQRVVWAPFLLFKLAYEFGLPKYNYEKFYEGLRSSTYSLLDKAEEKALFE